MLKYKINIENKNKLIDRIYEISSQKHNLVVNGVSSYSTPYNYGNDSIFNNLISSILNVLKNEYNNSYQIEDMWFNIYKTGGYVKEHNHLSEKYKNLDFKTGVFYIKKPSNSGELYVDKKKIKLNEDDLIIFDAKQNHYTTENKNNKDKVVISFNFLKKNIVLNNTTNKPFEVDNLVGYSHFKKLFTKKECEKIINIAKNKVFEKGMAIGVSGTSLRSSNICWLYPDLELNWVFSRVTDVVIDLNNRFFNFDISGLKEGFQFTNYKSPDGRYGKHIDKGYKNRIRKLSLSIQLTDPKEYEGGELYLYESEIGQKMTKEQGDLVLFPSYILHEIAPVTKGERNSLVSWVAGKQFR